MGRAEAGTSQEVPAFFAPAAFTLNKKDYV